MRKIDKSKLYAGMSLQERAKLAFKFTVSNDETRLADILATIPRKTYEGNDLAFSMRSTGLYYTAVLWGFEYQKLQGLVSTYLSMLAVIDENTNNPARIGYSLEYQNTCDKLEILFSLLEELDESHGLDSASVYAIAEVRCIAVGNTILDIEGDVPIRTPQVQLNHETKNKNKTSKAYYHQTKELLLTLLNQYENTLGNYTETDLKTENEILRAKLNQFETKH